MAVIETFTFPGLIINHAELNGKSVLTNGLEEMRKYNPETGQVLPLVLREFRQAPTLTAGAAGLLNGDYVYRIVPYNINEDEEGPAWRGPDEIAGFEITVTNRRVNIDITALRRDSPEITHWRVYRTIAGGSWPVMALVATVLWATKTYTDNTADGTLDFIEDGINTLIDPPPVPKPFIRVDGSRLFIWGDIPYSDGHAVVANGSATVQPADGAIFGFWLEGKSFHAGTDARAYYIEEYDPTTGNLTLRDNYAGTNGTKDYRICGDPDTLLWSEPEYENEWPAANRIPINKKEADKPAGLLPTPDFIACPKSRKTDALFWNNNPAIPFSRVRTISSQYGCVSHRTGTYVEGIPTWLSQHGIVQVSNGVHLVSGDLGTFIHDNLVLDDDGTRQICCAVDLKRKGQYIVFFPDQDAVTGCNRAVVWHYRERKFSTYRFHIEVTCAEVIKDGNGEETAVLGDANGYLWEFPFGDADGPPAAGSVSGTVSTYLAGSPCGIYDPDATFPTSGLGLAGMPVYIWDGAGEGQWLIIAYNTADTLYFQSCPDVDLDQTSKYYIGSIVAQYRTGWLDFGTIARIKRLMYASLVFEKCDSVLDFRVYRDFSETPVDLTDTNPRTPLTQRVDRGIIEMDGDDQDSAHPRGRVRAALGGVRGTHLAWELYDDRPRNPWSIYDLGIDMDFGEG